MLDTILANLDKVILIIAAVGGVLLSIIQWYKKLKAAWIEDAKNELAPIATKIISNAETAPMDVARGIMLDITKNVAESNEGKNNIVSNKVFDENPRLAKKAGFKTVKDVSAWISTLYPIVKPVIKDLLGKKKG